MKIITKLQTAFFVVSSLLFTQLAYADETPIKVNVDNFVRAETAIQFDRMLKTFLDGKVNTWAHLRNPTPLDNQIVIRMNRDTLYSTAIIDISQGATLTVPRQP